MDATSCDVDLSVYDCYALDCAPELTRQWAANHFTELATRSELGLVATSTAAMSGKAIKVDAPNVDSHWRLTYWGQMYLEVKERNNSAMFGGEFTRKPPVKQRAGSQTHGLFI
jgi:hypothetical protein